MGGGVSAGVVVAALVMAPVLQILHDAYGIGSRELAAPQASLMASVTQGILDPNAEALPWDFVAAGVVIAIVIIIADRILEARKAPFRAPVLAVAVGSVLLGERLVTGQLVGGAIVFLGLALVRRERPRPS